MASRYTLIKGSFPIVGTEPDGDTLRFQPDNPALVEKLGPAGQAPSWSHQGSQISVRFEAIDALETHFQGSRQQTAFGNLATRTLLATMGFVSWEVSGTKIVSAQPESVRGYVAANSLDSYGRMIGFVFSGESAMDDGASLFLDAPLMGASANAQLLAQGLVYPAFYTTLPTDLKDNLAAQSKVVRERGTGLWPDDAPSLERAAAVPGLAAAEALVMWPKLFRRLASYFQSGQGGLSNFTDWLRQDVRNRDDYVQLPDGEIGNMHDLVQIDGDSMRMRYRPEDLVVLPDTFAPAPSPAPAPAPSPAPGGPAPVRIVAALPNPAGVDQGLETVTLINTGAAELDLQGWQLRDRQLQAAGRPGLVLAGKIAPGDTLRVKLAAPVALSNDGDDIVLIDRDGGVADRRAYTGLQARSGLTLVF